MSDLSQRITNLPPEKRSLLEQHLQIMAASSGGRNAIPKRSATKAAPLSFAQQRLWFLAQLYPGLTAYNEASAYRFKGELNVSALQNALTGIIQRHEILRTTYHSREDGPIQVIEEPRRVPLPIVDLTNVAKDEYIAAAQLRFAEVIERPFDLSSDLMLRACVYRLGDYDHIFLAVRHHIASDGWSSRIFWKELAELYKAELLTGYKTNLPDLPVQYADYAEWQRTWLQGERLESQLAFWRQELAELPSLQLPTDRRPPEELSFKGQGERFTLDHLLVAELRALGLEESATLYTVLLAAYAVLLSRLSAQGDIVVGTHAAGRIRSELEPLIGFFVNTLVIRLRLEKNISFRMLLGQVRATVLNALDNQTAPFEKLVEILEPERRLNRNPLVNTAFQLFEWPDLNPDFLHLGVELVEVPNVHAKFDLACAFVLRASRLESHWRYATDIFDASTVKRMIGHYQRLLQAVVADPDTEIGNLPLLTAEERQKLLVEWNNTAVPYPRESTIDVLFEAQAHRTPQAAAVYFEGETLTYKELNQRANQVAQFLIEQGIQPDELVGMALERSLDLVVVMLAILKAGAAYLPLDTEHPSERIERMLVEARCRHVVTHKTLQVPALPTTKILYLDREMEAAAIIRQNREDPRHIGGDSSNRLAYVMFTSGSTGRPKGVMVPHRGVVRLVKSNNFANFGPKEHMLHFAPSGFDLSTLEIWGPLLNGGQLFIYPPGQASLSELADYLRAQPITMVWLTAGLFHQMVDNELDAIARIPHVISVGDIVSPRHVHRLLQAGGECQFTNGYGPTENTTFTTCYTLLRADEVREPLPIGRPINNTTVYILDANLQPVPVGVPGELYAGGDGLALGYLNRPELTAAAFIPNPFGRDAHDRLYRTGDLARYLPDGNIEFLGRVDHQVKIRGFRVEPGEIEAILMQHPNLREVVVVAREVQSGDRQLVAYLVASDGPEMADANDVRAFCSVRLPDYMVPTYFCFVEEMPLTPNGKVDRAALPEPDNGSVLSDRPFVPPRSPKEKAIAYIWREVLNLQQVGMHDNFFELGGHSLLATKVISRMERLLRVRLPLRTFFEKPTIAGISAVLSAASPLSAEDSPEEYDEFIL